MTVFHTNCTLPPAGGARFVSAPNTRGTADIIWSCLAILVTCTWSAQHPNIPLQIEPRNWQQWIRLKLRRVGGKVTMMLVGIFIPEFLFTVALTEFASVYQLNDKMKTLAKADGVPWSKAHTFFANMGGFAVRFDHLEHETPLREIVEENNGSTSIHLDNLGSGHSLSATSTPDMRSIDYHSTTRNSDMELGILISSPKGPSSEDDLPYEDSLLQASGDTTESPADHQESTRGAKDFCEKINREARTMRHTCEDWLELCQSRYGDVDWNIDDHNARTARKGLLRVREEDLERVSSDFDTFSHDFRWLQSSVWFLDANQLLYARECGIVRRLPDISANALADRSKSDPLVAILAVLQVLWLVVQLIDRAVRGTHTSQLELSTFAVAICTFAVYLLLWNKPKNVGSPTFVRADQHPVEKQLITLASKDRGQPWSRTVPNIGWWGKEVIITGMKSFFALTLTPVAMAFGALHTVAWDFAFPTYVEQQLWRASAIILVFAPLVVTVSGLITWQIRARKMWRWLETVGEIILVISCVLYTVARCFILVESVRSLAYLPPSTFVATWASELPSFS